MLLKITEHMRRTETLKSLYKGTVVSVTDPKQLGRIKVNIPAFLEGDEDTLPFFYPEPTNTKGAQGNIGSVDVPPIGSEVLVRFPFNDVYSGFYVSGWVNKETTPGTFNEDYPNSSGTTDDQNNKVKINKGKRITEFLHGSGSSVRFLGDGTVEIRSSKAVQFVSEDEKTQIKFDMVSGSICYDSRDTNEVITPKNKLTTNENIIESDSHTETVNGARQVDVVGGEKKTVGGSLSTSITSNEGRAVAGDHFEMLAKGVEKIYGTSCLESLVAGDWTQNVAAGNKILNVLLGNYALTATVGSITQTAAAGSATYSSPLGTATLLGLLQKLGIGGHPLVHGDTLLTAIQTKNTTYQVLLAAVAGAIGGSPPQNAAAIAVLATVLTTMITAEASFASSTALMNSFKSSTD